MPPKLSRKKTASKGTPRSRRAGVPPSPPPPVDTVVPETPPGSPSPVRGARSRVGTSSPQQTLGKEKRRRSLTASTPTRNVRRRLTSEVEAADDGTPSRAAPVVQPPRTENVATGLRSQGRAAAIAPPITRTPAVREHTPRSSAQGQAPRLAEPLPLMPVAGDRSSALVAQRAVQTSHQSVMSAVRNSVQSLDKRLENMDEKFEARLTSLEDGVMSILRVLATNTLGKEEAKSRQTLVLLPMQHIYNGRFYNRCYGMVFVNSLLREVTSAIDEAIGAADPDEDSPVENSMNGILVGCENFLHSMLRRVLDREKSDSIVQAESEPVKFLNTFRRDLSLVMIPMAQKNKTIGTLTIAPGAQAESIPRPRWLRPGFVRTSTIKAVHRRIDESSRSVKASTPKGRGAQSDSGGAMWEDSLERAELAQEIVKRLNTRHTQQLNKSREHSRSDFFSQVGFLWHSKVDAEYLSTLPGGLSVELADIPETTLYSSSSPSVESVCSANRKLWHALLAKYSRDMEVLVSYQVEVVGDTKSSDHGEKKNLTRKVNFLIAALSFCMTYTFCKKGDDVFAMHSKSMKAVFCIACVFREMVRLQMDDPQLFAEKDSTVPEFARSRRTIRTLVFGLSPVTAAARGKLLGEKILRISSEDYNLMNVDAGSNEGEGGDQGQSHGPDDMFIEEDEDNGEEDNGAIDGDMAALENLDFSK